MARVREKTQNLPPLPRRRDVAGTPTYSGRAGVVMRLFVVAAFRALFAGLHQRRHQRNMLRSASFGELATNQQDFFGMTRIQYHHSWQHRHPHGRRARLSGVPRLAGAESIKIPGLEIGHHLRRRDDDDADVAFGINSLALKPFSQQVTVGRERSHHTEGEYFCIAQTANFFEERSSIRLKQESKKPG